MSVRQSLAAEIVYKRNSFANLNTVTLRLLTRLELEHIKFAHIKYYQLESSKQTKIIMTGAKVLVGSATRFITGRNAVQTVYWRETAEQPNKFIKVSKTLQFKSKMPGRAIQEAQIAHNSMGNIKFN